MFTPIQRQELLGSLLADFAALMGRREEESAGQQLQAMVADLLQLGEALDPILKKQHQRIMLTYSDRTSQLQQQLVQLESEVERLDGFIEVADT